MSEYITKIVIIFSIGAAFLLWIWLNACYILLWHELKKKYPGFDIPFRMPVFDKTHKNSYPFTDEYVKKN